MAGGFIPVDTPEGMIVSYGKEVPDDYDGYIPDFCEVFHFPASKNIVFNYPPYPQEDHGSVVKSVFSGMNKFKPEEHGFKWSSLRLPVYNDDDRYQNALKVKLRTKEVVSSVLSSKGEKPCEFVYEIIE